MQTLERRRGAIDLPRLARHVDEPVVGSLVVGYRLLLDHLAGATRGRAKGRAGMGAGCVSVGLPTVRGLELPFAGRASMDTLASCERVGKASLIGSTHEPRGCASKESGHLYAHTRSHTHLHLQLRLVKVNGALHKRTRASSHCSGNVKILCVQVRSVALCMMQGRRELARTQNTAKASHDDKRGCERTPPPCTTYTVHTRRHSRHETYTAHMEGGRSTVPGETLWRRRTSRTAST